MLLTERYPKGNGEKFVLVITYDEWHDLIIALQDVQHDLGLRKTKANEASDTYAYGFEIEESNDAYETN